MPITNTVHETPKGRKYVRTHAFGVVTGPDAAIVMDQLKPGQPMEGFGVLSVADSGTELQPEARRVFTSQQDAPAKRPPVAMVVTSAPLRITISFVMRVSGSSPNTKFFGNEADAKVWLETELDADA